MATILIFTSIVGVVLALVLGLAVIEATNESKLAKYRSKSRAVADLLNYAAIIDDGIISLKDGAMMAAWEYSAPDHESSTDSDKEILSKRLNSALAGLGNGWMVHIDAMRTPAQKYSPPADSYFTDPICKGIDDERRKLFESKNTMYEGRFVLVATYLPPLLTQRKFAELLYDDDRKPASAKERSQAIIDEFKRNLTTLENRLSMVFKLKRLKSYEVVNEDGTKTVRDAFLEHIQSTITGEQQPVNLPRNPMYLDAIVGGQELWGGVIPVLGRKYIQVVAIEGLPTESTPGMLNVLAEVPCAVRWSTRFIFMDQHKAVGIMDNYRKKWRQKKRGLIQILLNPNGTQVDQDAANMEADAESALAEIKSGEVAAGYYTSLVVLLDENRDALEREARKLEKAINMLGFAARIESNNTLDAFFGSLAGHGVENVRRPLINTLNLADLLPVSSIWTGAATAPCPFYPAQSPALMFCEAKGATPFRLNLHVGDVGHTLVFGPTGAGKSTLLSALIAQFRRYRGMKIFAFDKGMSLFPLASAINAFDRNAGNHYEVGGDGSKLAFCPLQFLDTVSDLAWAAEWIDLLLSLNKVETTPGQRNLIMNALETLKQTAESRSLTEFVVLLQDGSLREALKPYTLKGQMGHIFDAQEDRLAFSNFTVFEIEELMNLGEKFMLPILLYIFRRIEKRLDGSPALISIDEAWIALGHPKFRDKIREWLKVLRKANCAVLLATQSLSDAANSGILDVLMENTATQIYLPNPKAKEDFARKLYEQMGLNSAQIALISDAIEKREYYYTSKNGRRLFSSGFGKFTLAFCGVSDKEGIAAIKSLMAASRNGNDHPTPQWVDHWLARNQLEPITN